MTTPMSRSRFADYSKQGLVAVIDGHEDQIRQLTSQLKVTIKENDRLQGMLAEARGEIDGLRARINGFNWSNPFVRIWRALHRDVR